MEYITGMNWVERLLILGLGGILLAAAARADAWNLISRKAACRRRRRCRFREFSSIRAGCPARCPQPARCPPPARRRRPSGLRVQRRPALAVRRPTRWRPDTVPETPSRFG